MVSNFIAAFAAPSIALVALGAGAAQAPGAFDARPAYGSPVERLSEEAARACASAQFGRADLNASGALDVDEYAALAVVAAELARLNGFIAFEIGGTAQTVALPAAASALTGAERARVDAVARREFYDAGGVDALMSAEEFAREQATRFAEADRNRSGALGRAELVSFAARVASIVRADA